MTLEVERVVDGGVYREEALGRRGRLEALHLSFAAPDRLVGDLGPMVVPQTLLVARREPQPGKGGAIRRQPVGRDLRGSKALLLEQHTHELPGRRLVPPALDEDVQHFALVVDGTPQVHPPPSDPHDHLVEVPAWARPAS